MNTDSRSKRRCPDSHERRHHPCRGGELLNFGWLWQDIADYAVRQYPLTVSAMRLAASISRACDELYQFRPGDDTTVACMRIIDSKPVHLMTGPARNPEDDVRMVQDFMDDPNAKTIVCGGTSATIVSRVLGKKLDVSLDYGIRRYPHRIHGRCGFGYRGSSYP